MLERLDVKAEAFSRRLPSSAQIAAQPVCGRPCFAIAELAGCAVHDGVRVRIGDNGWASVLWLELVWSENASRVGAFRIAD